MALEREEAGDVREQAPMPGAADVGARARSNGLGHATLARTPLGVDPTKNSNVSAPADFDVGLPIRRHLSCTYARHGLPTPARVSPINWSTRALSA